MKVISSKILREFWAKHAKAETALSAWELKVRKADWKNTNDIKKTFGDADVIGDNRVIFNIRGNHFRIIAIVIMRNHRVYVRWIGTHKEHDQIDVKKIYI